MALCPLGGCGAGRILAVGPTISGSGRRPGSLGSPPVCGGIAAAAYGCGQTAWWVQQGKNGDIAPAGALSGSSDLLRGAAALKAGTGASWPPPAGTADRLLYTAAQGVILLLTAEAGIGLVGLVLHVGCASFMCSGEDSQCMDHRFSGGDNVSGTDMPTEKRSRSISGCLWLLPA